MMTIYVYSNESGELVDQHDGETNQDCEAWFLANYDINDYSTSYNKTN